jgi:hypothetical protein
MSKKYQRHQREVMLVNNFDKAWGYLKTKGETSLQTEKKRKSFIAKASVSTKGMHSGERVILCIHENSGRTSAYVYKCCWGYHTNCYGDGTRIGMYCEALDKSISL